MPMTGEQKRAYQKEYMRQKRAGLTGSNNKSLKTRNGVTMVGDTGLEPVTFAMSTQCSNQLS
jgi:hypothetical protein